MGICFMNKLNFSLTIVSYKKFVGRTAYIVQRNKKRKNEQFQIVQMFLIIHEQFLNHAFERTYFPKYFEKNYYFFTKQTTCLTNF